MTTYTRADAGTFGMGAVGGAAALIAGLPLPWLIGAIIGSAGFRALAPAPPPPKQSRKIGQLLLGATVALNLTPDVLATVAGLAPLMAAASLLSIGAAALIAIGLSGAPEVDRRTAFFACMPGGVAEMASLADRFGANPGLVSLAQSLRIVTVVVTVPIAMHLTLGWTAPPAEAIAPTLGPGKLIPLFGLAFALALVFDRYGVLNSWFLASLCVGGALAASEAVAGSMPPAISAIGQVLIGAGLGARLDATLLKGARRVAPLFVAATGALILLNAALAGALMAVAPLDFRTLALATAPGGIAEMSITAKELGALVAAVTAFHFVRIVLIVLLSAPFYARVFAPGWAERGS